MDYIVHYESQTTINIQGHSGSVWKAVVS